MFEEGLCSVTIKQHHYLKTTYEPQAQASNILSRDFTSEQPNEKWVSDITYIPTNEGWLYLAVVLDIFSRKIVGWAMSSRADSNLTCTALKHAIVQRTPDIPVLFHSDQGVQYTSMQFSDLLEQVGAVRSLSRKGNCWDNAVAESFFSKLKREWVPSRGYRTKEEARQDIFFYLEAFYNSKRRHASLGYLSPNQFEAKYGCDTSH